MSSQDDKPSIPSLLHRVLKYLSLDWISIALDFGYHLRHVICSNPSGPYEILNYESTLEFLDTAGKHAIFRKRLQIKFLQNGIIAFEDFAWGDGQILAEYKCVPGVVVDKYREGDRWNVLISLRGTKNAGDVAEFNIERREKNTFTNAEEWLQTEIRRRVRRLRMNVIFPKGRQCARASLVQRSVSKEIALGPEHFHTLPNGRQLVSWETNHMRGYDMYTIKWKW